MTHEGIVSGYEQWMRSWDASEATIDARLTLIRARLKEWGLPGLDREHVEAFLANPAWSRWTKATYHGHLKNFCEYLVAAGYLGESPMSEVRSVRRPHGLPKPLSPVQMALALDRATTHHDGRLHDWITLGRRAGLRCHEIAKIQGEHLTSRGLYVLGKGGKEAILPIHPDIAAIAARRPAAGYWFPSPYGGPVSPHTLSNLVSEFFDTLGIEGSIHRTRHNFGTDLIEAGVDLRTVQELMRHASLATTQVYTLVSGERLASAIAKLTAA